MNEVDRFLGQFNTLEITIGFVIFWSAVLIIYYLYIKDEGY